MSASKAKGTKAESAVVAYLQANGFPFAERLALQGNKDRGDITGVPGVVLEVKDHARLTLGEWVNELVVEMRNAHVDLGAVIHHRRGKGNVGDWYATLPVSVLVRLLAGA